MNDNNSKILPEVSRGGSLRSCLMAQRDVLCIDIAGQIPDLPPQPAMVRAHAIVSTIANLRLSAHGLPHINSPLARSGSFKNAMLLPRRDIAHRELPLTQNTIPSNEAAE